MRLVPRRGGPGAGRALRRRSGAGLPPGAGAGRDPTREERFFELFEFIIIYIWQGERQKFFKSVRF